MKQTNTAALPPKKWGRPIAILAGLAILALAITAFANSTTANNSTNTAATISATAATNTATGIEPTVATKNNTSEAQQAPPNTNGAYIMKTTNSTPPITEESRGAGVNANTDSSKPAITKRVTKTTAFIMDNNPQAITEESRGVGVIDGNKSNVERETSTTQHVLE